MCVKRLKAWFYEKKQKSPKITKPRKLVVYVVVVVIGVITSTFFSSMPKKDRPSGGQHARFILSWLHVNHGRGAAA